MVPLGHTRWVALAVLLVLWISLADSQRPQVLVPAEIAEEPQAVALIEGIGDDVELIVIGADEDPRGIVLRRWRRFLRNTVFNPGKYFKKIVAAMVIPGTIAGAIAGTVASSIVGVGAGGLTGGIAGAGLGGLSGILVPKLSTKTDDRNSKIITSNQNKHRKKYPITDDDEYGQDDADDDDDDEDEDENNDDDEEEDDDDEDDSRGLGRNVEPVRDNPREDDEKKLILLLRGSVNVDRLIELRKKMKLLKIKKKFQTRSRHRIWN